MKLSGILLLASIFYFFLTDATAQTTNGELSYLRNSTLLEKNKVTLYPNPATDFLNVEISNTELKNVTIKMYNIIGNVVNTEIEVLEDHRFFIKLKDLPPGYYLLAIKDGNNKINETYKFLKR